MKINIVTVNFNSSDATLDMIESLKKSIHYISTIFIVDNDSAEKDYINLVKGLERFDLSGKVCVKRLEDNIGYFGGLNKGLDEIDDKSLTYTIVCNNDLIFTEEFFTNLSESVFQKNVYALSPSVKTVDGVYQNPSMKNKPSLLKKFFLNLYFANYYIGIFILKIWRFLGLGSDSRTTKDCQQKEIFLGIGAIYIILPEFFKNNDRLYYPSFLYSEEVFLSRQIQDTGGVQLYYPKVEVTHMESVSTSKIPKFKKYKMTQESFKLCRSYYDK
jgi:GT2 family glycosyltransferase